ncbi:MAG: HRDC domain-containing protein, partial [Deltaproteobacteria bacterium]|nr:HRDC domain-containing protein [Deltaproteobacteria bacterium]
FEKAQEINRPPFMILPDHHLVGLSRLENPSLEAMTGDGLLSPEKARRFGPELLFILQNEQSP